MGRDSNIVRRSLYERVSLYLEAKRDASEVAIHLGLRNKITVIDAQNS